MGIWPQAEQYASGLAEAGFDSVVHVALGPSAAVSQEAAVSNGSVERQQRVEGRLSGFRKAVVEPNSG